MVGAQIVEGFVDEIDITPPESVTGTELEQVERNLDKKLDDIKTEITATLETALEKLKQGSVATDDTDNRDPSRSICFYWGPQAQDTSSTKNEQDEHETDTQSVCENEFLIQEREKCQNLYYGEPNPSESQLAENPNWSKTPLNKLKRVFPDCIDNHEYFFKLFSPLESISGQNCLGDNLSNVSFKQGNTIFNLRVIQNWFVAHSTPYHLWGLQHLPKEIFGDCVDRLNSLRGTIRHMSWPLCCRYVLDYHDIDKEIQNALEKMSELVPAKNEDLRSFLLEWYSYTDLLCDQYESDFLNCQLKKILDYYPPLPLPLAITSDFKRHYDTVVMFQNIPALGFPRKSHKFNVAERAEALKGARLLN